MSNKSAKKKKQTEDVSLAILSRQFYHGQAELSFKVKRFPSAVNFSDFLSVLIDN
jgi:hypothetical protein